VDLRDQGKFMREERQRKNVRDIERDEKLALVVIKLLMEMAE
jgi:hypothetical protein